MRASVPTRLRTAFTTKNAAELIFSSYIEKKKVFFFSELRLRQLFFPPTFILETLLSFFSVCVCTLAAGDVHAERPIYIPGRERKKKSSTTFRIPLLLDKTIKTSTRTEKKKRFRHASEVGMYRERKKKHKMVQQMSCEMMLLLISTKKKRENEKEGLKYAYTTESLSKLLACVKVSYPQRRGYRKMARVRSSWKTKKKALAKKKNVIKVR